jgi:hypothetical protein
MFLELSCQPEITYFQVSTFYENVGGLQISMDETILVYVLDSANYLLEKAKVLLSANLSVRIRKELMERET